MIPGWEKRYQNVLQETEELYKNYIDQYNADIQQRNEAIAKLLDEYEADKKKRLGEEGAKPRRVRYKALK